MRLKNLTSKSFSNAGFAFRFSRLHLDVQLKESLAILNEAFFFLGRGATCSLWSWAYATAPYAASEASPKKWISWEMIFADNPIQRGIVNWVKSIRLVITSF